MAPEANRKRSLRFGSVGSTDHPYAPIQIGTHIGEGSCASVRTNRRCRCTALGRTVSSWSAVGPVMAPARAHRYRCHPPYC